MKLFHFIWVFWLAPFIEGAPNDYVQWLQPRDIGDIPVLNWFFGSNDSLVDKTENTNSPTTSENYEESKSLSNDIQSENSSQTDPSEIRFTNNEDTNQSNHEVGIFQDHASKVQPVEGILPNEKPEPVEDFLKELEIEIKKSNNEDRKKYADILEGLEKTLEKSPKPLARVFIDKAWRLLDIGLLNSSRRIRSNEESSALTNLLHYLLLGWENQSPGVSTFNSMFPTATSNYFGNKAQHNLLGGAIGLPNMNVGSNTNNILGLGGNKSLNDLITIICLNGDRKGEHNDLFIGKTNDDTLNNIRLKIDKGDTNDKQKWLIILELFKMLNNSELDDEIKKRIHDIIIIISRRPDFEVVFEALKKKAEKDKDPRYKEIQNLFKKGGDTNKEVYVIVPSSEQLERDPGDKKKDGLYVAPVSEGKDYEHDPSDRNRNDKVGNLYVTVVPPSKTKSRHQYDPDDQENKHEDDPGKNETRITVIEKQGENYPSHISSKEHAVLPLQSHSDPSKHIIHQLPPSTHERIIHQSPPSIHEISEDDPLHIRSKEHIVSPLHTQPDPSKHIIHQLPASTHGRITHQSSLPTQEFDEDFLLYYPYTDLNQQQRIIKDPTKGFVTLHGEPLYTILLSIHDRLRDRNLDEDLLTYIINDLVVMGNAARRSEDTKKIYEEIMNENAGRRPTRSRPQRIIKESPENNEHTATERYELPPTVDENGVTNRGYVVRTTTTRSSTGGHPFTPPDEFSLLRSPRTQSYSSTGEHPFVKPEDVSLLRPPTRQLHGISSIP